MVWYVDRLPHKTAAGRYQGVRGERLHSLETSRSVTSSQVGYYRSLDWLLYFYSAVLYLVRVPTAFIQSLQRCSLL